ncbi:MAG: anti-sigma factor antagonist [Proteobacteria bacterium]|nr:anti-sigma factor antagonist [Pseudomonadota bacterium]
MSNAAASHNELHVQVHEKFTFTDSEWFRNILNTIEQKNVTRLIIDFSATQFIDSAALGMLLLAREELGKRGGGITLLRAQGQVDKIFKISHFHTLFDMR